LRTARPRISVAQHWGEPDVQRGAWRPSRGAAAAATAKARTVVKSILIVVVRLGIKDLIEKW
jgi:hypothetical protein